MEELEREIENVEEQIRALYHAKNISYEAYRKQVDVLLAKRDELRLRLYFYNGPALSNSELDLYEVQKNRFEIYLHNTRTCIGRIEYRGRVDSMIGDIGYDIDEEYRGHHYALKSLHLIKDRILSTGETEVRISAFCYNLPSIKTIQSFGGTLERVEGDVERYRCSLVEDEEMKRR